MKIAIEYNTNYFGFHSFEEHPHARCLIEISKHA